jgi:hypothetical protein
MSESCHLVFCVGLASSGQVLGCLGFAWDERRVQMSPDTHHMFWIHTSIPLILGLARSVLGCFCCVWDERRVKMSPATHQMFSMNPYKTDTDVFLQVQSTGSTENTKRSHQVAMLSVWGQQGQFWAVLRVL